MRGTSSVYAVVDQAYANDKITPPQADVVRLVADLKQVDGVRKISNVTVLEGVNPARAASASGSSASSVPGQCTHRRGVGSPGLRAGLWLKVEASRRQNDPRKATCGR